MDEQEFNLKRDRFDLISTDIFKKLRKMQLDMIVQLSMGNIEPLEVRGMLRLVGKTDEWRNDFIKIKDKR